MATASGLSVASIVRQSGKAPALAVPATKLKDAAPPNKSAKGFILFFLRCALK